MDLFGAQLCHFQVGKPQASRLAFLDLIFHLQEMIISGLVGQVIIKANI
jgi:hypothetical protein